MNKENALELAKQAAGEALKEYETKKERESKSRVFRNTKMLMKNYNAIKSVVENGIYEISQIDEDADEDEIFIASIKRSKMRSLIILTHIDRGMIDLEREQRINNTSEKYNAFKYVYIDGMTQENATEACGCAAITVHRWCNEMINRLGVYIFGIDGVKLI